MRFTDVMTYCMRAAGNCEFLTYRLKDFYGQWKKNRDEQFRGLVDRKVIVSGRIGKARAISRLKNQRFHLLHLFETTVDAEGMKSRNIRNIRVEIPSIEMREFDRESYICMDDLLSLEGKIVFYEYFGDYWLTEVTGVKVIERSGQKPVVKYT